MELLVGTQKVKVADADLLGEGGEARVFRWKDLALKIFHAPSDLKRQKLERFPRGLPRSVIGPVELCTDKKGGLLGYAMPLVQGAEDAAKLSSRRWREGAVSNAEVVTYFSKLKALVEALHAQQVIVGDLNDGNVLMRANEPFLIDADSMQFAGLPCIVGHERFLDPQLYGVDLTRDAKFSAATDWYALAVMLFASLTYVHPFGGVHRALPTQLRRAEARHSVFRPDVIWPRHGVHYRVLPDDALHHFTQVFEKDLRAPLPDTLLSMRWSKCSCGLEHARAVCPECQALGPLAARLATRYQGRCTSRQVFHTTGRILAASMQGGLRYLFEENGEVRREDSSVVMSSSPRAGTRFFISGSATWVVDPAGQVSKVDRGRVVERASTGTRGTVPIFAASASAAYRTEAEWLLDANTGARVGQVLEGQTHLWTGERVGLGFYRAGGFTSFFVLETGRAGLREVKLPRLEGRLVGAHASFDDRHIYLCVATETDGRQVTRGYLLDGAKLIATSEPSQLTGAALLGSRVVTATDGGLLAWKQDSGRLVEGTLFTDSQPFVSSGDELYPSPDGSLFVVGVRDITQLSLA